VAKKVHQVISTLEAHGWRQVRGVEAIAISSVQIALR
jgi:hypothetical protein